MSQRSTTAWTITAISGWLLFLGCMALGLALTIAQAENLTTPTGDVLTTNSGDPLTTGQAPAFQPRDALNILRTWGDPSTTGRMLSLMASPSDDRTTLDIRAFATDGTDAVVGIILVGNPRTPFAGIIDTGRIIAKCPVGPADKPDICNYSWPVTGMIAGNNILQFVTTHKSGKQFQIPTAFARPTP